MDRPIPLCVPNGVANELRRRTRMLERMRSAAPEFREKLMAYYAEHPADFISDWCLTSDPRNDGREKPIVMPFVLFPRQRQFVDWVAKLAKERRPGMCEKSRDMGMTWVCAALGVWFAVFQPNRQIAYGSRKLELVDNGGDPDSIFWKIRFILETLPREFRGGWAPGPECNKLKLISFPATGSTIVGQGGDDLGRGGRSYVYFVDEAAFLMRPEKVDAALSMNTECRIDVSSVNGTNNPFYKKRITYDSEYIFTFHWRDDPRKGDDWYRDMVKVLDPVVVAQEIDLNYNASQDNIVLPAEWVQAAVDFHKRKGFEWMTHGPAFAALDLADTGSDKNAQAARKGRVLGFIDEWSGTESNLFRTAVRAAGSCRDLGVSRMHYDATGVGAAMSGDFEVINKRLRERNMLPVEVIAYHGGGGVVGPKGAAFMGGDGRERSNEDTFANRKAQSYWHLRTMLMHTYRASIGQPYNKDMLISIDKNRIGRLFSQLVVELSQPVYKRSEAGLLLIDKTNGGKSPNIADAVVMAYAPQHGVNSIFG